MTKSLVKPGFFPSAETAGRIENSDKTQALQTAGFRLAARLHELESQFQAKAAELRTAYLAEVETIQAE